MRALLLLLLHSLLPNVKSLCSRYRFFARKKKARVLFCYGGYCREEPMFEKEKVEEAVEWCYGALLNEAAIERERESHRLQHHIGKTNMQ